MVGPEKEHTSDQIPAKVISGLETLAHTLMENGIRCVRIEIDRWSTKAVVEQAPPNGGKITELELFSRPLISETHSKIQEDSDPNL